MIGSVGTSSPNPGSVIHAGAGQRAGYGGMAARKLEVSDPADTAQRIIGNFDVDASGSVDVAELRLVLADNGIEGADQLAEQLSKGLGGEDGKITEQGLKDRLDAHQRAMNVRIDLMQMQAAMSQDAMATTMGPGAATTDAPSPQEPSLAAVQEAAASDVAASDAAVSDAGVEEGAGVQSAADQEVIDPESADQNVVDPKLADKKVADQTVADQTVADEASPATRAAPIEAVGKPAGGVPVSNRVSEFLQRYDTDGDGTAQASEIRAVLADRGVDSPKDAAEAMIRRLGGSQDALTADQLGSALRASDKAAAGLWEKAPELNAATATGSGQSVAVTLDKLAVELDAKVASDPMAVVDGDEATKKPGADTATGVKPASTVDTAATPSGAIAAPVGAVGVVPATGAPDIAKADANATVAPTAAAGASAALFDRLDSDGDGKISMGEFSVLEGDGSALPVAAGASSPAAVVTPEVSERIGSLLDNYRKMSGDFSFDDLRPMFSARA